MSQFLIISFFLNRDTLRKVSDQHIHHKNKQAKAIFQSSY